MNLLKQIFLLIMLTCSKVGHAETPREMLERARILADNADDVYNGEMLPATIRGGLDLYHESLDLYNDVLDNYGVASFDIEHIESFWWVIRQLHTNWDNYDQRLLILLIQISNEHLYSEVRLFVAEYYIVQNNHFRAAQSFLEALLSLLSSTTSEPILEDTLSDHRAIVGILTQTRSWVELNLDNNDQLNAVNNREIRINFIWLLNITRLALTNAFSQNLEEIENYLIEIDELITRLFTQKKSPIYSLIKANDNDSDDQDRDNMIIRSYSLAGLVLLVYIKKSLYSATSTYSHVNSRLFPSISAQF